MARKQMNIIDVRAWLASTWPRLRGRHVANVYLDKGRRQVLVKLKGGVLLVGEPGRRLHVTTRLEPPKEFKPDPLVVLARKHMRNDRLVGAGLIGGDRIVYLESSRGYRLVFELVPRGVAALVDPEGTLLAATSYPSLRDRVLRPKAPYKPPPPRPSKLDDLEPSDVIEALAGEKKLVPPLVRKLGIPAEAVEEALHRAGIPKDRDPSAIGVREAEAFVNAIRVILEESLQGKGYLVVVEGSPVEADPFAPSRFEGEAEVLGYESLDEALDTLFTGTPTSAPARPGAGDEVEAERQRLLASLARAEETARGYLEKAEELRRAADLVARRYHEFGLLAECLRRGVRDPGELSGCSGLEVAGLSGRGLRVVVEGVEVLVPWESAHPDKLIVHLYKEAGVYEAKAKRALEARREVEERLAQLHLKAQARRVAERYKKRRRYWFEKFHYTITRNGFLVVGGRDAGQNETLVRRYLEEGDIFMHADIHGAPAVVVKTGGKEPGEEDLLDAAVIAAAYSKAWKAGLGSVRVYWVPASQVSLSPPTGEYLARGGVMVYGRKRYLPPVRVRLWLGIALDPEGVPRLLPGSEEVVSRYSIAYATLVPGDESRIEAARKIREELARLAGEKAPYILAVPEQDIAMRLPGRTRLAGARRGGGDPLVLPG